MEKGSREWKVANHPGTHVLQLLAIIKRLVQRCVLLFAVKVDTLLYHKTSKDWVYSFCRMLRIYMRMGHLDEALRYFFVMRGN